MSPFAARRLALPMVLFSLAVMFFIVTFPLMKMTDRLEKTIKARGFLHD